MAVASIMVAILATVFASTWKYSVASYYAVPPSFIYTMTSGYALQLVLILITSLQLIDKKSINAALLFIQCINAIALFYYTGNTLTILLLTIVAYEARQYFRLSTTLALIVVSSLVWAWLFNYYWHISGDALYSILHFVICLLAILAKHYRLKEKNTRLKFQSINRELISTRTLLKETAKVEERLAIARDFHDLLGHHLTALSLNIETAIHCPPDKTKETLASAKSIVKHAITDVRNTVSHMREHSGVNLTNVLTSSIQNISAVKIELSLPESIITIDANSTQAVVRCVQECITNAIRHGQATKVYVSVAVADGHLQVSIRNNGKRESSITPGNGIKGMKERVAELQGDIEILTDAGDGFCIKISLPIEATA